MSPDRSRIGFVLSRPRSSRAPSTKPPRPRRNWLRFVNMAASIPAPRAVVSRQNPFPTFFNSISSGINTSPPNPLEIARLRAKLKARKVSPMHNANILIPAEEREEFESLRTSFYEELRPAGAIEQSLFDELVSAAWQLSGLRQMEAEVCAGAESHASVLSNPRLTKTLDRLARHHTRIQRSFHLSLQRLEARIRRRRESVVSIDYWQISKRSQFRRDLLLGS